MKGKYRVLYYILILFSILVVSFFLLLLFLISGKMALGRNVAADCGNTAFGQDCDYEYNGQRYNYTDTMQVFLVMGIDKEASVDDMQVSNCQDGGQADFIVLVTVDDNTKTIKFVTVNRNFIAPIDMYEEDGTYMGRHDAQIAVAHGFGDGKEISCIREAEAVSRLLYGVPINGYVSLNLGAISALTDVIGGVELNMDDAKICGLDNRFAQGNTVMDGEVAHEFLKYRDVDEVDSSTYRLERQRLFMESWMRTAFSLIKKNPVILFSIMNTAKDYMITDLGINSMAYLLTRLAVYDVYIGNDNIDSIPGEFGMLGEYEAYYPKDPEFTEKVLERFFTRVD